MPLPEDEYRELVRLARENNELLRQNSVLLKKLHRHNVLGVVFKILWIGIMIGLPLIVYAYLLKPYLSRIENPYNILELRLKDEQGKGEWLEELQKYIPFDTKQEAR